MTSLSSKPPTDPAPFTAPLRAISPVEELLLAVLIEMRGLRQDLAQRNQDARPVILNSPLSRADLALLGRLLPAIGGALGSELFLVRELFGHDAAALRLALRELNAKQVGRLFRRAEGQAIGAYLIQREGVELHAVLWRVAQVGG
jgi:hypothetical protein